MKIEQFDGVPTWEMIVEPEKPIRLDDLVINVAEGVPSPLITRHPDIYQEVLNYWQKAQLRATWARSEDMISALTEHDEKKIVRMSAQIGGVGQKHRLSGAFLEGKRLSLAVAGTNYMEFIGTNEQSIGNPDFRQRLIGAGIEDFANPDAYFANPLAVCAALYGKPLDGGVGDIYVPVSLRSGLVMIYPDVHHVFGGVVDRKSASVVDFGAHMGIETEEEVGLRSNQIGDPVFFGIARQIPSRIPEAILGLPVYVSQEELKESWRTKAPGKFESRQIEIYQVGEIPRFLHEHGHEMVPSGAAALTKFHEYAEGGFLN